MKFKFYALILSGICIVFFLMQLVVEPFTEFFLLNSESFAEPWRFVTSLFLHGNAAHLLYNLFALAFFGSILEKYIGSNKLLFLFFFSGVLSNLISINFYSSSLGASGAIFGIIGALIIIRPGQPVFAFGLPMPIFIAGILWGAGDIIGAAAFLAGNAINNTGNIAHLSGMFFGILFGFLLKDWKSKKYSKKLDLDEDYILRWEDRHMN